MVIDKPQKVEIQKIDRMIVLIWPGDLMLSYMGADYSFELKNIEIWVPIFCNNSSLATVIS